MGMVEQTLYTKRRAGGKENAEEKNSSHLSIIGKSDGGNKQ